MRAVAETVRGRLATATGVPPRRVARLVLVRLAVVHVTAIDVDVVSDLADLPIEVRLACLDRDPGFVSSAGRRPRFHFR